MVDELPPLSSSEQKDHILVRNVLADPRDWSWSGRGPVRLASPCRVEYVRQAVDSSAPCRIEYVRQAVDSSALTLGAAAVEAPLRGDPSRGCNTNAIQAAIPCHPGCNTL